MIKESTIKDISISPILVLLLVSISIFVSHVIVMTTTGDSHYPMVFTELLIDSVILTALLFPLLYFLVFKPLLKQIGAREKAQLQLLANERKFRDLVDSMNEGLIVQNNEGKITYVNQCFADMINLQKEELIDIDLANLLDKTNSENLVRIIENNENNSKSELVWKVNKGNYFYSLVSASKIYDENNINVGRILTITDITKRKEAELKLLIANDKIKEADNIKSEFLSLVSHEIRTPINVVFGFTNIIKEEYGETLSKELDGYINSVKNGLNRLIRTIDLILNTALEISDLTKYEYNNIDISNDILPGILKDFEPIAKEKGISLSYNISSNKKVYADEYSIKQILTHLLDNAIKFTEEGEVVISSYVNTNNEFEINIKDTGIGISEEYSHKMFNIFSQEDSSTTRKYDGNGLGLFLVKKYCEKNNIKISVISEKGKGSSFILSFPSST
ncbi:MAG: PAS domain-containing sensor histidine kinase [Bacteroidota bacterium]